MRSSWKKWFVGLSLLWTFVWLCALVAHTMNEIRKMGDVDAGYNYVTFWEHSGVARLLVFPAAPWVLYLVVSAIGKARDPGSR